MPVKKLNKYQKRDIVYVKEYDYNDNRKGNHHLFVIINDDGNIVPIEYFGLIVSSQIKKRKEKSKYKYNEFIEKDLQNGLTKDSIVKCDAIYKIDKNNIVYKIGTVNKSDFLRFLKCYQKQKNR